MKDVGVDATRRYRLLLACPDEPGIIYRVSGALTARACNIVAFDQHSEGVAGGYYFMRAEFDAPIPFDTQGFEAQLAELLPQEGSSWRLRAQAQRHRLGILVSRESHCLEELAWQVERQDIDAEIKVVISNHARLESIASRFRLPFYVVPVSPETKAAAESQMLDILRRYEVDTVVLARYMQILTERFIAAYPRQIINIHHSFLPAFVGANPYQQAYDRGVKLIGATAHYVTSELDAGPIIEQDVHRVDHRHQVEDFKRIGRYVERMVLARAVRWHVEDRVLPHGNRTIVFPI
ncbi:MAG: formyltetrahydrofolate deformylase [Firmicutes bacterium]|nr:formyltetrahydrofolate deformylase [Bacillota bacterium]